MGQPVRAIRSIIRCSLLIGLTACGNYHSGQTSSDSSDGAESTSTLSYATVREMVFQPYCFQCHTAATGNSGGINLETYASTFPNVSDIQSEVQTNDMPDGNPPVPVPDSDKAVLFAWINAGAPENSSLPLPGGPTIKTFSNNGFVAGEYQ